ncbi:MAG: ComEC/Rec2 family competence protein [Ruminococcus sp.]|nr:ComEC/Rec2 family competence protein [Ruminococcus sp.]
MTKRLFAYIGLSMLVTFAAVFYFGIYGIVSLLSAAVVILIFAIVKGNKNNKAVFIIIAVTVVISIAYSCVYNSLSEIKLQKYDGKAVTLSGTVLNSHKTNDRYIYELNCDKINNNPESYKVLLGSVTDLGAEYSDIITCKVVLNKMDNNYYKSKGYDYNTDPEDYFLGYTVQTVKDKGIGYIPVFIRDKLTYSISVLIPGYEGELCNAVTLGDRHELSQNVYSDFRSTGLSYLIAISGLHMSLVAGFVFFITRTLRNRHKSRIIRGIIIILVVLLYIAVTGFSFSAVRSGIMLIVVYSGYCFSLKSDTVNNLGIAALILTVFNPYSVGDVGMLMSFASTAGIVFVYPVFGKWFDLKFGIRIKNQYNLNGFAVNTVDKLRINSKLLAYRTLRVIYDMLTISFCAEISISPLTLSFFGVCNPFVIIYSVFEAPFIGVMMLFSAVSSVLWYIPFINPLSAVTALIAKLIASWLISFTGFLADIPFITFYFEPRLIMIWLGITILIFAVLTAAKLNRRNNIIIVSCISAVLLLSNICAGYIVNYNKKELRVISSGNGSTVAFKSPEGVNVLSSGGTSSENEEVFDKLHILSNKVNTLVVQSPREKSDIKYAVDILREFDVEKVLLYYRYNTNERIYRAARECGKYSEFKDNEKVSLKLTDSITDKVENVNGHTWQYISDGNVSALIAPYKGKAWEIPEEFRNPDYLILNNDIKNIEDINYGKVIWTSCKEIPSGLKNACTVKKDDYIIEFN